MEMTWQKLLVCLGMNETDDQVIRSAGIFARQTNASEAIFAHVMQPQEIPAPLAEEYEGIVPSSEAVRGDMRQKVSALFDAPGQIAVRFEVLSGTPVRELIQLAATEDVDLIVVGQPRARGGEALTSSRLASRLVLKGHCSILTAPRETALKLDCVLVPVRNSECSRRALQAAIDLACLREGEPRIIAHYVYPVPPGYARVGLSYEEFTGSLLGHAEAEYEALMSKIDVGVARVEPLFTDDPEDRPALRIAEAIAERHADAIVIGSRGRTGAAGVIMGHVTEALVVTSPVPVLAVKRKGENVGLLQALGIIM